MSQLEQQLVIGPNATISRMGLMVNGRVELMGHAERFNQIVQMTTPAVVSVLAVIFPHAKAVPGPDGTAVPSEEAAWEHYNRHARMLAEYPAASPKAIEASRVLLQWCVAAEVAVEFGQPSVEKTPEFLAVEYLAHYGPAAASCTAQQWNAHQDWLASERTVEAFLARMDGNGRKSPLPAPLYVCAPWPEYLGALWEGPSNAEAICYLAHDVVCDGNQTTCRFHNHSLRLDKTAGIPWMDKVEAVAQGKKTEHFDCALTGSHDGIDYVIRAQRTIVNDMPQYAFRMLRSSVPDLGALYVGDRPGAE